MNLIRLDENYGDLNKLKEILEDLRRLLNSQQRSQKLLQKSSKKYSAYIFIPQPPSISHNIFFILINLQTLTKKALNIKLN